MATGKSAAASCGKKMSVLFLSKARLPAAGEPTYMSEIEQRGAKVNGDTL